VTVPPTRNGDTTGTAGESESDADDGSTVAISGGSMGGLFTGVALRAVGHDVDIFERADGGLESRRAGIVAQSNIRAFLDEHGVDDQKALTTTTSRSRSASSSTTRSVSTREPTSSSSATASQSRG
jgi:2-polyprenyl-6-methoxyphenol hydroxylase-like FAD-dependent oxidoreductase